MAPAPPPFSQPLERAAREEERLPSHASCRLLIPALLAEAGDLRLLEATLAGVPEALPATLHPAVQTTGAFSPPPDDLGERLAAAGGAARTQPLLLGGPRGKWGALREAFARVAPVPWCAVADGDDAYDTAVLVELLARARRRGGDLYQGQREQILLDPSDLGRRRALLEPVVNEWLRLRLAARGVALSPALWDLQSGLLLVRFELLARFFALPRMDQPWQEGPPAAAAAEGAAVLEAGAGAADHVAPGGRGGGLPWGSYGGELHLHAFAAGLGAAVEPHPVRERFGRVSGQTPAGIGRQLAASALLGLPAPGELERAASAAARGRGWSADVVAAALAAAREALGA